MKLAALVALGSLSTGAGLALTPFHARLVGRSFPLSSEVPLETLHSVVSLDDPTVPATAARPLLESRYAALRAAQKRRGSVRLVSASPPAGLDMALLGAEEKGGGGGGGGGGGVAAAGAAEQPVVSAAEAASATRRQPCAASALLRAWLQLDPQARAGARVGGVEALEVVPEAAAAPDPMVSMIGDAPAAHRGLYATTAAKAGAILLAVPHSLCLRCPGRSLSRMPPELDLALHLLRLDDLGVDEGGKTSWVWDDLGRGASVGGGSGGGESHGFPAGSAAGGSAGGSTAGGAAGLRGAGAALFLATLPSPRALEGCGPFWTLPPTELDGPLWPPLPGGKPPSELSPAEVAARIMGEVAALECPHLEAELLWQGCELDLALREAYVGGRFERAYTTRAHTRRAPTPLVSGTRAPLILPESHKVRQCASLCVWV